MVKILDILTLCEAIACATGFIFWKKIRESYWKWFPVYLAFIVASELIGAWLSKPELIKYNPLFYNYLEIPVEFLFFFWLFFKASLGSRYSWLPIAFAGIYIASWVVDRANLFNRQFAFSSFSYTVGNLLLLLLILRFFIRLVTSDAILSFHHNMLFWVCLGLLLFYLGSFPFYGLFNSIYNYSHLYKVYDGVVNILDCLMYLLFSISFICGKPKAT